jgi:glycosyltransferase involved in cell wall biosynthesis
MPVISVGMPVYNGERFVEESIKSVLAQTFGDFELLIADNASTDRSSEICQDYATRDSRIRYWRNDKNVGAAANYNRLFAESKSPYFRWSNADDLLDPALHKRCLASLEAEPSAVLAAGRTILIDEEGKTTGEYDDNLHITDPSASVRLRNFLAQVGLTNVIYGLMRKEALGRTDLMGDGRIPAADTVMMGQLILQGSFLQIDVPLFYRRMHSASSSADRDDTSLQESFWSAGKSQFRWPHWRTVAAYMRGVSRAPGTKDTVALYKLMARQVWLRKRYLALELFGRH